MTDPKPKRRVLVVLVDRANYGRLKPVMQAISDHPALDLLTVCSGSMVLRRFDRPLEIVKGDGFDVHGEVFLELEGSTPVTMAKSVGFGIIEFASEYQRLKPDVVLIIGDRYEALGAAVAAAYMNIPILHVQGGEVSGSIDESARHAISKLAHFHFPSTERSAEFLKRMGERPETILGTGCPSSDIARTVERQLHPSVINARGSGAEIDTSKPFLLTVFHPTTTEYGKDRGQMTELLRALQDVRVPTLLLWPNIDAGSDEVSKAIRLHRTHEDASWLRTLTNLPPDDYLRVLAQCACAVGNSSSFVRDASYFGTPVVLLGNRQANRERGEHVTVAPLERRTIYETIKRQLEHGRYAPSSLYGDGHVAGRIANALATLTPYLQKQLSYVTEDPHR